MNYIVIIERLDRLEKAIAQKKHRGWVDIKSACSYTGLSASTIRRAIQKGVLKASTNTGKLLFKVSDVDRWLNG